MKKVFILKVDYCNDGDSQHDILGVFSDVENARKEMNQQFELDKSDSWISSFFVNGKFDEDYADERGVVLEVSDNRISIDENCWSRYTEFNIEEHEIK